MIIKKNDYIIASQIKKADSFLSRFRGLMGVRSLSDQEGILLFRCSAIHCFFMRMTIDAVYLSKDFKVLDMEMIEPWRIGKKVKSAAHVLELKENTAEKKFCIGDQLTIIDK